ncbi:MAG: GH39 family glycosyl hydrolase [Candidatus Brocadiia bacterium]
MGRFWLFPLALGLSAAGAAPARVARVIEDFEAGGGERWEAVNDAPQGERAGATGAVWAGWGGLTLRLDGVPDEADGLSFWVRTDDGRTAALTFGLYEWEEQRQVEAFGERLWATPTWQKYTFPLADLPRLWARAGNKELDPEQVRTLQFQRLIWAGGGLRSERLVFDHVAFVAGAQRRAVEDVRPAVRIEVNAAKRAAHVKRFWRCISPGDTAEQNSFFEGPDGAAMRLLGADGVFDYARIAWHVSPGTSPWVDYTYGKPIFAEGPDGKLVRDFAGQDALIENVRQCDLTPMILLHGMPRPLAREVPAEKRKPGLGPPSDYGDWQAVVRDFADHYARKYGAQALAQWYWEVWNEPDLWWHNWKLEGKHAGREAYATLFDHAAAGLAQVVPRPSVGGPAVAGYPRDYCEVLARHAAQGTNAVTGERGSPLAFISYHCYANAFGQMVKLYEANAILRKHGLERDVEVHATEFGNAIWGHQLSGRYQAAAVCQIVDAYAYAARADQARVDGVYWFGLLRAFSRDCDAYFAPPNPKARMQITTLFLHVKGTLLAKPVTNLYRALDYLGTEWLEVSGAHFGDPVNAMATLSEDGKRLAVLVYRHDWLDRRLTGDARAVELRLVGVPFAGRARLRQFRIDSSHSDVTAAWRAEGSPPYAEITAEQVRRIREHARLEPATPERQVALGEGGTWTTSLRLEPHAIALFVLDAGE